VLRSLPPRFVSLLCLCACGLPRDADGTLERVRGGTLRVGMVVDTPWVTDSAGGAGGVEAALVRELAARVRARPHWVHAPEARLMESLKNRDLDLVVGGIQAKSPYAKEVGFTRPFYTDTLAIGARPGAAPSSGVKGSRVAVETGDPAAALVRKQGATPVSLADLARAPQGLVAAPAWRLDALGLRPTGITLHQQKHVMAVAPGENAFLLEVDRLLDARRGAVPVLLRRARP
jgi:polar amino acid transport system substrate-binding protein